MLFCQAKASSEQDGGDSRLASSATSIWLSARLSRFSLSRVSAEIAGVGTLFAMRGLSLVYNLVLRLFFTTPAFAGRYQACLSLKLQ